MTPHPVFMNRSLHVAWICFCLLVQTSPSIAGETPLRFQDVIAPILQQHCLRCHSPQDRQGEISLATFDDLRESGFVNSEDPDASHLVDLIIAGKNERPAMPKEGEPLSDHQVSLIRQWISEGAQWPQGVVVAAKAKADSSWWSLQAITHKQPPDRDELHPIDRFIRAKLAQQDLLASPQADDRTLIRRLYYDLIGLPPSPPEVESFLNDDNPQRYEQLVDRLLSSEQFGERWARHWLDIVHYADTHGFERDKLRDNAWHYRDYVIRSLNQDKPYDQFLREQIAGDVLAPNDDQSVIATGFLAAGPWDFVGQVETQSPLLRRAARALDLDDIVTQVMTSTVAMTVNCARCHDHKLDPISQAEYYRLTAVFAGLKRADRDISPSARKKFDRERDRLDKAINAAGQQIGRLQGKAFDLADIVGGGNGYGSGEKGLGIDARTGKKQERPFGDLGNVRPGHFALCETPFVDGVFVPASGMTKISSTDLQANGLPENSGKAWDMIRNGPVSSQFSTKLGETDFAAAGHSMIGLHANAGISFDLDAIREAAKTTATIDFTSVVGYGGRTIEPSAEYRVLLDGDLKSQGMLGRNDAVEVDFEIPVTARFLTFISTDGGNGYGHDQISFGDPQLRIRRPQPFDETQRTQLAELVEQRKRLEEERKNLGAPPVLFGVVGEQPPVVHLLVRGDPESAGDAVAPGTLSWCQEPKTFGDNDMPEGSRRVALAQWITDPSNPLTSRVIVNRLWHWHFGRGIVGTPSDFGYGGQLPTHPELLDWLAAELIRSGWSLKHIHRLIVTSQTYRMQSRTKSPSKAAEFDSDNRLLWRMNPRRLEAEAIRDAVLSVSGKLNPQSYGPGYRDFDYQEAYAPIYTYKTADSPELWRRSVYRFIVRTTPQQFLSTLDCPDPANLTAKRNVTTTALQSLALFNNDFMLRQAGYFADRVAGEVDAVDKQIELAFQLAFSRPPGRDELAASRTLIRDNGLMHLCRVLLNANEFIHVD